MPDKFDDYYMKVAHNAAELSYSKRLKVGAVAVNDRRILSDGFNGTAAGDDNCCEDEDGNTKSDVIHAEMNVILKAAKHGQSLEGATLYCTDSPCVPCSRAIRMAGFKNVIYDRKYRDNSGIEYLVQRNVPVSRYDPRNS